MIYSFFSYNLDSGDIYSSLFSLGSLYLNLIQDDDGYRIHYEDISLDISKAQDIPSYFSIA